MTLTETQEQILAATMDIIVRDGLARTSMRAVAEEAEVSLGLLSYHFDDKDNLILAALRRAADHLSEVTDERMASAGDDPRARVSMAVRVMMDPEIGFDDFATWLTIWAAARTNPKVAEAEREFYNRLASQLFSAISTACPEVSPKQARDRTTDVMAFLNGLWINQARWGDEEALERGLRRCEAIALGTTRIPENGTPEHLPGPSSGALTAKIGGAIAGIRSRGSGSRRRRQHDG